MGGLGFPWRKKRGMAVQTETGEPGKPEIVNEYQTPLAVGEKPVFKIHLVLWIIGTIMLRDSPDVII